MSRSTKDTRSRVARLRTPFVVTVAAGVISCGGKKVDDAVEGCPAELPQSKTACEVADGTECPFPELGTCFGAATTTAVCQDGQWITSEVSCNPPPPLQCPDAMPANGTPCYGDDGECAYSDGCGLNLTAACKSGTWIVGPITPCNPPAPSCPSLLPTIGAPCDYAGPACSYPDACGQDQRVSCVGGAWILTYSGVSCNPPPPPETTCPESAPDESTYCNYAGPACEYGDCDGIATESAECVDFAWVVSYSTCNPPPPDVECPESQPPEENACAYDGTTCLYEDCEINGVQRWSECFDGRWYSYEADCQPPPADPQSDGGTSDTDGGVPPDAG